MDWLAEKLSLCDYLLAALHCRKSWDEFLFSSSIRSNTNVDVSTKPVFEKVKLDTLEPIPVSFSKHSYTRKFIDNYRNSM